MLTPTDPQRAAKLGFDNAQAAIADAGFLIERLVEPRPVPEAAALNPAKHERLSTGPYGFIAFRLRPC